MIDVKFVIENPDDEVYCASEIIKRFAKKNHLNLDLSIAYDFHMDEEAGCFYPKLDEDKIFINPVVCMDMANCAKKQGIVQCVGYTSDLSIFSTVIHEFSHFVCYRIYDGLVDEYTKEFPHISDRLYLNDYCDHTFDDEVAEALTLYILNPMLLKMISERHWKFYNSRFKSPVACSHQHMLKCYKDFPVDAKIDLYERYGITYNADQDKFEKVEVDENTKQNVFRHKRTPALQPD